MYSTCIFCHGSLGRNDAIEHCPTGRRLAFDPARGRLWVVCGHCARWNLTPFEERWEALDECERTFRQRRLRIQTDNIGLARLADGTDLVRIGQPLAGELAAWRYGREFSARWRKRLLVGGGVAVAVGAGGVGLASSGVIAQILGGAAAVPVLAMAAGHLTTLSVALFGRMRTTRIVGSAGKVLRINRAELEQAEFLPGKDDPWRIRVRHSYGSDDLRGDLARRALGSLLTRTNRAGAALATVTDATSLLGEAGSAESLAAHVAAESGRRRADYDGRYRAFQRGDHIFRPTLNFRDRDSWTKEPINRGALPRLPGALRLALEMAVHETAERRAMEGELALLEAAWRDAESIAAIADGELTTLPAQ